MDTAKPKNQKSLRAAGQFMADTEFGVAVVVVSSGTTGGAQNDLVLTQARAMVVRDYLVGNFSFDDSQLKTLGRGKGSTPHSGFRLGHDAVKALSTHRRRREIGSPASPGL